MRGWMHDGPYDMTWIGPLFMLLVVALLVVGAVLVARMIVQRPPASAPAPPVGSSALHILEERFARGEIDEEEFRRRRDLLRG